jgi:hypothetical protein
VDVVCNQFGIACVVIVDRALVCPGDGVDALVDELGAGGVECTQLLGLQERLHPPRRLGADLDHVHERELAGAGERKQRLEQERR